MKKTFTGEYLAPYAKVVVVNMKHVILQDSTANGGIEDSEEKEEINW